MDKAEAPLKRLHEQGYRHGDFKARHVGLIDGIADDIVAIFDFGRSELCEKADVLAEELATLSVIEKTPDEPCI